MKYILKIEELVMFAASLVYFSTLHYSWGTFFLLLLTPDLSMIGYLHNTRTGAFLYNLAHHKGLALLTLLHGLYWDQQLFVLAGTILFAHSSMDRILGYGLKFSDNFKHTHLGFIGKKNNHE